jgi:predicted amidohydrolase
MKRWWWGSMDNKQQDKFSYKVAAVQFNPVQGELDSNRRRIAELLSEAAEQGAKLIVFPEMASSGYVWKDRKEISPFVETIPGMTTNTLHTLTRKYQCYVVVGLPEICTGNGAYYNSAVLIGPDGVVGSYRKTHLFAADHRWAREGNEGIPVFETDIGRIALLICMDAMYFEPTRLAALQSADLIAFPTNWVGASNNPPSKTWCLRAKENGIYWVASNRSDTERGAQFTGGSAVIGPNGDFNQALITGEGFVYGEVRIDTRTRQGLLEAREPSAYQELLLQPYLWKEGETLPVNDTVPYEVVVCPLRNTLMNDELFLELRALLERETVRLPLSNRLYVLPQLELIREAASLTLETELCLAKLQKLTAAYGGYIVAALSDTKKITAYLVGPEGAIGYYDQVHAGLQYGNSQSGLYREGFQTFELPFGRVGLLTEKDAGLPESYRILAKQGADLIAISGASPSADTLWMKRIWAFENDAVLAYALPSACSASLLFLHQQANLESGPETISLMHRFDLDMTAVARSRPFMRRSKTNLYDRLV